MVTIPELARLLGTTPLVIRRFLKMGYLIARGKDHAELPDRARLQWMKMMFRPLPTRPLFTHKEVMRISGMNRETLRTVMQAWQIPLYYDIAFGELITPDALLDILDALHGMNGPVRFDRAALVTWMRGMGGRDKQFRPHLPYSKLIDQEIARIARLQEPERTLRARAFWEAYRDAKRVSRALGAYQQLLRTKVYGRGRALREMYESVTTKHKKTRSQG